MWHPPRTCLTQRPPSGRRGNHARYPAAGFAISALAQPAGVVVDAGEAEPVVGPPTGGRSTLKSGPCRWMAVIMSELVVARPEPTL